MTRGLSQVAAFALSLTFAFPFVAMAQASASDFLGVRGTVRNADDNAPVSGALVLATWHATSHGFHSSIYHCLRIASARTGRDGSFALDGPASALLRLGLHDRHVDIRVYAAGLDRAPEPAPAGAVSHPGDIRMARTTQDVPDRLRSLTELGRLGTEKCESVGDAATINAYFESIAGEAAAIARTRYERAVAQALAAEAHTALSDWWVRAEAPDKIMQEAFANPETSDLERRDRDDMTPLMRAAAAGRADEVRSLLAAGASPNRTRMVNELVAPDSALTIAMLNGNREIVDILLSEPRTDVNLRNRPFDYTPLMKALRYYKDDMVERLLAAGADPNLSAYGRYYALGVALEALQSYGKDGQPLPQAERQFDILLRAKNLNLDAVVDSGQTALTRSLAYGNVREARRLLEAGANPNAKDGMGRTGLAAAKQAAVLNPGKPKYIECVQLMASWPAANPGGVKSPAASPDRALSSRQARKDL